MIISLNIYNQSMFLSYSLLLHQPHQSYIVNKRKEAEETLIVPIFLQIIHQSLLLTRQKRKKNQSPSTEQSTPGPIKPQDLQLPREECIPLLVFCVTRMCEGSPRMAATMKDSTPWNPAILLLPILTPGSRQWRLMILYSWIVLGCSYKWVYRVSGCGVVW